MNQLSLLIILLAALVIPLAMARFKITFLPTAVVEIIVGVFLGPSVFNWITSSSTLDILQNVGVIFLLFLSGMEIDFSLFKRKNRELTPLEEKGKQHQAKYSVLTVAIIGYASIVVMSILMAYILNLTGLFSDIWLSAILFMTISLGIVIAGLKEKSCSVSRLAKRSC